MPNLPAPYVSPWREFARNLRSMVADLRLRLQEIWRRNREGDLSVPGFWPQGLVPWFWPLILVLLLGLVVLLPVRSRRDQPLAGGVRFLQKLKQGIQRRHRRRRLGNGLRRGLSGRRGVWR